MPQRVFHPIFKIGGLPIILYMNLHIKFLVAQNHIIHRIDIILRAVVQILFTLQFPVPNSITIIEVFQNLHKHYTIGHT